jgi:hypothetical protein
MLALPVNPSEEPPGPSATSQPEPLAPPPGNMILEDPGLPPPPPVPSLPLPLPVLRSASRPIESVLPPLNPVPAPPLRAVVLASPDRPLSPRAALAASRPPRPPVPLRPILWLNRLFDAIAFGLGSPGRWLRRPTGRTLLGLVGLLLLAAAAALALIDRIGWTW